MDLRTFKFDEITISFESPDTEMDLEDCKRDALYEWIEDNAITINCVQMGDSTCDVFLLFNDVELASMVMSDYKEFTMNDLKNELFKMFVDTNLKKFKEIKN